MVSCSKVLRQIGLRREALGHGLRGLYESQFMIGGINGAAKKTRTSTG